MFDCYGKILDVVDDPSYFKSLKYLLDGDNCKSNEFDPMEGKCFGETSKQDTHATHVAYDLPDVDFNSMKKNTFAEISYSVTTVKAEQKTYNTTFLKQVLSLLDTFFDFYDVSFLKLLKLLVDGDVESNPGPVNNYGDNTPKKGRPKKGGFKGTPKKMSPIFEKENIPLGLLNQPGENVCFFNSTVQMLNALPAFRNDVFVH